MRKIYKTSLALFIGVFVYICIWLIPTDIHAEGLVAQGIAESSTTSVPQIRQKVITDIDELALYYMSQQVLDPLATNYGSFTDTPCYDIEGPYFERYSESPLSILAYAWSSPESKYYQDGTVLESVRRGLLCLCRLQCSTGGFPVGSEVETDGVTQPLGVQLQDYGDQPHQYFLGDSALYAYELVRDYLPDEDRQKIDTMLERLFEFSVIAPSNCSSRSVTYEGLAYPTSFYKERITIPRNELDGAARIDIVLRVEKIGNPKPTLWEASIGDMTLESDTAMINYNGINPYRLYTGWLPMSIATWHIDDVTKIMPYASKQGDHYEFDVTFRKVDDWDMENTYTIVRSQGDHEPTWISQDGQNWVEWPEDLAMQVWVYGNNADFVGTRLACANQETARLYLIHKSRWLFKVSNNASLLSLANHAFKSEVSLLTKASQDGIFPECNSVILQAVGVSNPQVQSSYGGWSPGHGLISMYFVGLVAEESHDANLIRLVQQSSNSLEYLIYDSREGYFVMNATAARDNNEVILTNSSKNLFALGFAALSNSPALEGILLRYESMSPLSYSDNPYPLFCHQIDCMPIVTLHRYLQDGPVDVLPMQQQEGFIKNFTKARLIVIKTRQHLYYISYGNSTPSGGCIADVFDLVTKEHEIKCQGASLDYGQPMFELKQPDGSSSAWDTQAHIRISSRRHSFKISVSGYLRKIDQTPTLPYTIIYDFFDTTLEVHAWLDGETYTGLGY